MYVLTIGSITFIKEKGTVLYLCFFGINSLCIEDTDQIIDLIGSL